MKNEMMEVAEVMEDVVVKRGFDWKKLGVLGIGVAAVSGAGVLIYKEIKRRKNKKNYIETTIPEDFHEEDFEDYEEEVVDSEN